MVKINGEMYDFAGKNITEMLTELDYNPVRVAVEVNFSIVTKAEYNDYKLKDEDSVEVVQFVGGG
ncbi:MAG: sulfur carrier protein ThiS [Lachnospiraceae bacterium]|nr:sulfur carrier protein ThiS [Lachnospiraceae bacterium]